MSEMKPRRVRFMMINPADFMQFFKKGLKVRAGFKVIKGAPADAEIVTITYDNLRNAIVIVVQSETYDEVKPGVLPPVEPIEIDILSRRR